MEQKYAAAVDKVFALLTDPRFLEARCLALGDLSAKMKCRKSAGGVSVSMARRIKRDLPALVAKVLKPESDMAIDEIWKSDGKAGWTGTMSMQIVGQPVTMTADFSLEPVAKGCVYRIEHVTKCSIPLIGGTVAKFAQGQVEKGCGDEFAYLVAHLGRSK